MLEPSLALALAFASLTQALAVQFRAAAWRPSLLRMQLAACPTSRVGSSYLVLVEPMMSRPSWLVTLAMEGAMLYQGLDAMDYKEHIDYDLVESTNPAFGRAIVRVNVFRNHRQVPLALTVSTRPSLDDW